MQRRQNFVADAKLHANNEGLSPERLGEPLATVVRARGGEPRQQRQRMEKRPYVP